jgi:uncharacterized protein (DUF1778 family)
MKTATKTRFDARLTNEQKALFEQAALILGSRSLTEFILAAASREADRVIGDNQVRLLSSKIDHEVFFKALMNPPAPNDGLKKAASKYKKWKKGQSLTTALPA